MPHFRRAAMASLKMIFLTGCIHFLLLLPATFSLQMFPGPGMLALRILLGGQQKDKDIAADGNADDVGKRFSSVSQMVPESGVDNISPVSEQVTLIDRNQRSEVECDDDTYDNIKNGKLPFTVSNAKQVSLCLGKRIQSPWYLGKRSKNPWYLGKRSTKQKNPWYLGKRAIYSTWLPGASNWHFGKRADGY